MKDDKLQKQRKALLNSKVEILSTLKSMENNEFNDNLQDYISELSTYDNHPGDIGTETFEMELNKALKDHEKENLKNINRALKKIKKNDYGICEECGVSIEDDRLQYMPEAKLCIDCANKKTDLDEDFRPVEEEVLYPPFGRTDTDGEDSVIYDGEDAWQEVEKYSTSSKSGKGKENKGIVEEIEEITNEEYKNQLPE
jgi:YteA family regulatory protein